jgi:nucleotide-binding universal stress UspA family protein
MFKQVFVPLDGSNLSGNALRLAARLADETGCVVTLCHVITAHTGSDASGPGDRPAVEALAQRLLDEATEIIGCRAVAGTLLLEGDPAKMLVDCIAVRDFDLVILGAHDRSDSHSPTIGRVGEAILRSISIPVLVVKADGDSDAST